MARHAPEVTFNDDRRQALSSPGGRRRGRLRSAGALFWRAPRGPGTVAHDPGIDRATVGKWRRRFVERGLEGLRDIRRLESTPRNASHWSSRMMAGKSGISTSGVQRIWRALGLRPHRTEDV